MALAQRINGNNSASMGNTSGKLSQKDIIPIQPVSQSTAADDNKAQIMQITATPYATCSTASATATKQATMQNFPSDYSPVVGSKIKVKFTNANTAATQMYLKVGTLAAKPCTCRGIAMGAGSVLAGSKIEFMYDGEAWDCQLCEAISAMDTTSKSPINSTALNGALVNYQPIVTNVINGNSEWDTGIYINKSIQNTNNYKYKKTHLVMLSSINGYGDTVSSRLVLISIGRSGNFITTTTVAEKSASASSSWLNNVQFIPSSETTETNDNNTLVIKNNNTVTAYSVEVRFL